MGRGEQSNTAVTTQQRSRYRPGEKTSQAQQNDETEFSATIDFVMFPREGGTKPADWDGYTIAKAKHEGSGEIVTLKGKFGPVVVGQLIHIKRGAWRTDTRYGQFFQVWQVSHEDPVTRDAIIGYLDHLPNVGDKIAAAIVDQLGTDCLVKIDKDPSLLLSIRGINQARLEELAPKWEELRAERKSMLYLSSIGLGDHTAKALARHFGVSCVEIIKKDPYKMTEVKDIGFRIADAVAGKLGIGPLDPRRLAAGAEYLLEQSENDGHICLTREQMVERAQWLLVRKGSSIRPSAEQIDEAIKQMMDEGRLWAETDPDDGVERIYTTEMYVVETRLLDGIEKMLESPKLPAPPLFDRPQNSSVTQEQWGAVENAFTERLSILVGGPGTGKTTSLKEVLSELDKREQKYVCLAPTGKAAKRMMEATGREASTIHRALGRDALLAPRGLRASEAQGGKFKDVDVVVIDESSMLDMRLAERVISNLGENTRLVLVGDPYQLPAVGAGSVLLDLIESKRVPTTSLTKVFRQAEGSLLVVNAHRIKDGLEPYWSAAEAEAALGHSVKNDWEFIEVPEPAEGERNGKDRQARKVLSIVSKQAERVKNELGVTDDEVLVTAPSRKGDAGVYILNQMLQRQRNPNGLQFRDGDQPLRVGDRVMNTKNRYAPPPREDQDPNEAMMPDVMNGEMGRVVDYDETKRVAWVDFGLGTNIPYNRDQLDDLIPSYAATTHKLQGSEAPAIICPLVAGVGSRMHTRNLVYTAQTRSSDKCIVIGSKDVLRNAISRDGTFRNTTLDLRVGRIPERIKERWERVTQHRARSSRDLLYGPRRQDVVD